MTRGSWTTLSFGKARRNACACICVVGVWMLPVVAWADSIAEVEPNDTKATAQTVSPSCGDVLTGVTLGADAGPAGAASTADYWLINSGHAGGGVHRYRLRLPAGANSVDLRGRDASSGASDIQLQTAAGAPDGSKYVAWYGLGTPANDRIYARVTGTPSTTTPYTASFECTPVTPYLLSGVLPAGSIRIAIPASGQVTLFNQYMETQPTWTGSTVESTFGPGEYFVAVSPQPLRNVTTGSNRTDFAGVVATQHSVTNSSGVVHFSFGPNLSSSVDISVPWPEPRDIAWIRFFVASDERGSCCIGAGCTENLTAAECSAQNGTFLGGGVPCLLDLCPRACCYLDGECRVLSVPGCTQLAGTPQAAGSNCAAGLCPALYAAGCTNPVVVVLPRDLPYVDTRTTCALLRNLNCTNADEDAVYRLDVTENLCLRAEVSAPGTPPRFMVGAACPQCPGTSTPAVRDPVQLTPGTYWLAVKSNPCGEYTLLLNSCGPRACCFDDGSCQSLLVDACTQAGGHSQAAGSVCAPNPCPPAVTCCLENGNCQRITVVACVAAGGREFVGQDACEPNSCDDPRACCLPSAGCLNVSVALCLQSFGLPQAAGSTCPAACVAVCLRGDANCDGAVDNFDIDPFVLALVWGGSSTPPAGWTSTNECWLIRQCSCDTNHDGFLATFDIDPFVACINRLPERGSPCP